MTGPDMREPDGESGRTHDFAHRTAAGLAWMSLSGGGQVVLHILVLAVLARHVSPAEFGVASAALVVTALSAVFTEAGVGTALVQRDTITPRHVRTAFTFQVLVSVGLWGVIAASSGAIASLFGMPSLAEVVPVLTLALVLQSLTVGDFLMQRDLAFRRLAAIEFFAWTVGYGGVSVTLAILGHGVWSIVLGNIAQALLRLVSFTVLRPHSVRPLLDGTALRQLLFFGGGYTLGWWANFVARQGDNFVVGRWLGAAALGLYTRAYSLMRQPAQLFGRVVGRVLFPAMAAVQHDRRRLRQAYLRSTMVVGLVVLPFAVVAALLSTELIVVLLGERWLGVRGPFNIMVLGMLFRTSYKLSDALTTATGHVYPRALRQGVYATLVVGGALVGQQWGIEGVAAALLVALTVNFLLMAQLALRVTDTPWSSLFASHVPGLIMAAVVAVPTYGVARILRQGATPDALVLVVAGGVATLVGVVTLRVAPHLRLIRLLAGSVADVLRVVRPGSRVHRVTVRLLGAPYGRPPRPEPVLEQVP